jgi:WD40 repeat protein
MFRWFIFLVVLSAGAYFGIAYLTGNDPLNPSSKSDQHPIAADTSANRDDEGPRTARELGIIDMRTTQGRQLDARPVLVHGTRVVVAVKQEVSADRDGAIVFVGTALKDEEGKTLPPDRIITTTQYYLAVEVAYQPSPDQGARKFPLEGDPEKGKYLKIDWKDCFTLDQDPSKKVYTRWKEGMPIYAKHTLILPEQRSFRKLEPQEWVKEGQLLAQVDPKIALYELDGKLHALEAAEADRDASEKTREESRTRYLTLVELQSGGRGVVSPEELRGAQLTWHRYIQEELAKGAQVRKAASEVITAMRQVRLHEVHAAIDGVVKAIYKQKGDGANAKATADPIMQIQDPRQLRADGLVEQQESTRLEMGQPAELEVSLPVQPIQDLKGHLQEVTAIAVNKGDRHRIIFTAGEDRTLRGWDPNTGKEAFNPIEVPATIRSLACTPKTASADLLVAGFADGSVRIIDLGQTKAKFIELPKVHSGAVLAASFNADGTLFATAGDDRSIVLWSVVEGKKLDTKINAHRAAITSLTFTSTGELLSAGKDNVLQVWATPGDKRILVRSGEPFERRSGDVSELGAFEDRILFDAGKELRVLSLKDRKRIEGVLRNPTGSSPFTTLALFSPDGKTILTNGAVDGRLQLWRAPPRPTTSTITAATWTNGLVTFTASNSYVTGQTVTVTGVNPSGYNGDWTVTSATGTSFTVRIATNPGTYVSGGSALAEADPKTEGRGSELRHFVYANSSATCGAFDPDGKFAVTGMQDGHVLIWKMPSQEEIEVRVPATISMVGKDIEGSGSQVRVWAELKDPPAWLVPGSTATIVVPMKAK